jgi:type I restriction enzyme, S subunit
MNETLEAIARAIFKSWFIDFDPVRAKASGEPPESICRRRGLTPELVALFPDRFQDSELGEIPAGWHVTSLKYLFRDDEECVITGPFGSSLHAHDYREEGVPLILVKYVVDGDILDDGLPLVGDHKLSELERYRLQLGDIVFTCVGAVGRSAYIHERCVGFLISGQMLRLRIPEWSVLHPRYLAQLFLEKTFTEMVEVHAVGTTRPSLNTGLLRAFRFIAPPGDLVQVFAEKVAAFDALVQKNLDVSCTLAAVRDALLPKLISGELQVKDAERFLGGVGA